MIDENAAHGLDRNSEEVSPVIVGNRLAAEKPDTELINEGIGLQRMIWPFALQQAPRDLPQLHLDGFEQSLAGVPTAVAPEREPSCDLPRIRHASPKIGPV